MNEPNDTSEREDAARRRLMSCLSCGTILDAPLQLLGSLRCLDCRSTNGSLDPALVEARHEAHDPR